MKILNQLKKVLFIVAPVVLPSLLWAQQQPQYTQFMYSRLILNPAYAGISEGIHANALGRWQWVGFEGAPNTQTLAIDSDIPGKNAGVGLVFSRDEVAITTGTSFQLNYAYHIPVWAGKLSMGLSGGIQRVAVDYNKAYVTDADAKFAQQTAGTTPNFGVGLHYEGANFWAGISVPSILKNTYEDQGLEFYDQARHFYVTGGYRYQLNERVRIEPSMLLKLVQGSTVGSDFNVMTWVDDRVAGGLSYRPGESVDLIFQFKAKENLKVGYAFDYVTNSNVSNLSTNSHEVLLAYSIPWNGQKDNDSDGIKNREDGCPEVFGPAENGGCPWPDADGDGIPDREDQCADEAGLASLNGCPDRDGDGIRDDKDECPDEPGNGTESGCPDRDEDGMPDHLDACPDAAGDAALAGCPDNDGDGIADHNDKCPDEPGIISNHGCPEITEETKQVLVEALKGVQFKPSSDRLKTSSYAALDKVVEVMKNNPSYKLKVSGYSDSSGDDNMNLQLSKKRAQSVKKYLADKGVDESRVSAEGYGEVNPVADNSTAEGRAKNRRVEFEIVYE